MIQFCFLGSDSHIKTQVERMELILRRYDMPVFEKEPVLVNPWKKVLRPAEKAWYCQHMFCQVNPGEEILALLAKEVKHLRGVYLGCCPECEKHEYTTDQEFSGKQEFAQRHDQWAAANAAAADHIPDDVEGGMSVWDGH